MLSGHTTISGERKHNESSHYHVTDSENWRISLECHWAKVTSGLFFSIWVAGIMWTYLVSDSTALTNTKTMQTKSHYGILQRLSIYIYHAVFGYIKGFVKEEATCLEFLLPREFLGEK